MVNLLSIIFSFFCFVEPASDLEVRIVGIEAVQGNMMIAIYQPTQKFLGEEMFVSKKLKVEKEGIMTFNVSLPEGRYAISVFHDTNADGKLNKSLIGIPSEPYGFSVTRGVFGPPSFEEASFEVPEKNMVTIKIE